MNNPLCLLGHIIFPSVPLLLVAMVHLQSLSASHASQLCGPNLMACDSADCGITWQLLNFFKEVEFFGQDVEAIHSNPDHKSSAEPPTCLVENKLTSRKRLGK